MVLQHMKTNNPFTLTYGLQPKTYLSDEACTVEQIVSAFASSNPITHSCIITGPRGSGKTALMHAVANKLQESKNWVVLDLNSSTPLVNDLSARLIDEAVSGTGIVKLLFLALLGYAGLGFSDDAGRINFATEQLVKRKQNILITIDEAKADANMVEFANRFQMLVRHGINVFVIITGLYEDIYKGDKNSIPLSLRSGKMFLKPLKLDRIKGVYKEIFAISGDEALKMAKLTKGYPFGFQALGALYWEYRDSRTFDEIVETFDGILEDYVYTAVWSELSESEKLVIKVIPDDDARMSIDELVANSSAPKEDVVKSVSRLIAKCICIEPEKGCIALALPRMRAILSAHELTYSV